MSDRRLFAAAIAGDTAYVADASGTLIAFDLDAREVRWTVELSGQEYAPVVDDGTVYACGGSVRALSAEDGSERWRFETDGVETSSPTVSDGTLFFKSSDVNGQGTCHALDADSGTEVWRVGLPSGKEGRIPSAENVPPAVEDGLAFFADKESLYAFDADEGVPQWKVDLDDSIDHAPTVVDGTVYACGARVRAFSASDGTPEWNAEPGSPEDVQLSRSPAVTDDTLVVADGRAARVWALDRDAGTIRWTFDAGEGTVGTPVVADGTVYTSLSSDDDRVVALGVESGDELVALDAKSGETRWEVDGGSDIPVVADEGNVYVARGTKLIARDGEGDERWRFEAGAAIETEPAVADGTGSVATDGGGGTVHAIDAETGSVRWQSTDGCAEVGTIDDGPSIRDGRVYVVADGTVVALDGDTGERLWTGGAGVRSVTVGSAVYTATSENEVVAYDRDGSERWGTSLPVGDGVSGLVADDGVYAVTARENSTGTDSEEWLVALDDGGVRWTYRPTTFSPFGRLSDPVIADGTVYVGASDRRVYALDPNDGGEVSRFETGGTVRSLAAGESVYAVSDAVYAFR